MPPRAKLIAAALAIGFAAGHYWPRYTFVTGS